MILAEIFEDIPGHNKRMYNDYAMMSCVLPEHGSSDHFPSMRVKVHGFFCLKCEKGGSIERLMSLVRHNVYIPIEGKEYAPRPYDFYGAEDPFSYARAAVNNHNAEWYWGSRGFTEAERRKYMLGSSRQGTWATIPVKSPDRTIQTVVFRTMPSVQEEYDDRYFIPPGGYTGVMMPDPGVCASKPYLFVAYGMIDAYSIASLGFPVVSSAGSALSSFVKRRDLERDLRIDPTIGWTKRVILLPDKGEEGNAVKHRQQWSIWGSTAPMPDNFKDPNEIFIEDRNLLTQFLEAQL